HPRPSRFPTLSLPDALPISLRRAVSSTAAPIPWASCCLTLMASIFSELIRGVDRAARARGLHLLVSSSHGDSPEATSTALQSMNGRVDGLLMMSPHGGGGSRAEALPPGLPTVLMNTRASRGARAAYLVDDFGGARAMTCHLASCGYRRIAHIRGPRDNFEEIGRAHV